MSKGDKKTLLGIRGGMRCGKDVVGSMIQYLTSDCSNKDGEKYRTYDEFLSKGGGSNLRNFDFHYYSDWKIKKFADKLKDILCILLSCTRHDLEDEEFKNKIVGEEWWYYKGTDSCDGAQLFPYDTPYEVNQYLKLVKPTPRTMMQLFGTDLMRKQFHPNVWVNSTFADYKPFPKGKAHDGKDWSELYSHKSCNNCGVKYSGYKRQLLCKECIEDDSIQEYEQWIITDVRFKNEVSSIKKRDGLLINVIRPFDLRYPEYAEYADGFDFKRDALYDDDIDMYRKLNHRCETELNDCDEFDYTLVNDGTLDDLLEKVREMLIKEEIIN